MQPITLDVNMLYFISSDLALIEAVVAGNEAQRAVCTKCFAR
jgi:hypothetical protein